MMGKLPPARPILWGWLVLCAAGLGGGGVVRGAVVINELVAANSDRQLDRSAPGYPRLGVTAPWYWAEYDDGGWASGSGPFGFGSFSGVTLGVNTSAAMQNKTPVLYVRKRFTASAGQAASTSRVELVTRYNDGFIAFLNGVEVARRNMGNAGMFGYCDQTAFNTNPPAVAAVAIDLGAASDVLLPGDNVLCIQTHNKALTGGDASTFLSMADLHLKGASPATLVTNNATWRYFVGLAEPSGGVVDHGLLGGVPATASWATLGFNDSSWPSGIGPFGMDSTNDYALGCNLLAEMHGVAPSLYTRVIFTATAAEAAASEDLVLNIDYDDGIIVYLNGREVARRNVGVTNTITPHDALANGGHGANGDNGGAVTGADETLGIGPASSLLAPGDNVLAVQVHNSSLTSSDLIGRVTLRTTGPGARALASPEDAGRYFVGVSEPLDGDSEDDSDFTEDTPDSEGDWIELYNSGASAVSLTGWSLTDDEEEPRKWYFPAGTSITAGGYLVVMATGYDVGPANGATYPHANFKLDAGGEYLGLFDASGAVVSEIEPKFPKQGPFHSYGRDGAGQFVYLDRGTPGAPNAGDAFTGVLGKPDFDVPGGFYGAGVSVQLSSDDAAATIRYTLDGSEPTEATGSEYSGPIPVPASAVLRARCFKAGVVPSATRTHTYLIAQSAARRSLPAICVSADPALALYGPNTVGGPAAGEGVMAIQGGGYPTNNIWSSLGDTSAFNVPMQRGRAFEKPSAFEFYPTNGASLRTDLGLRISGSPYSRPRYLLTNAPPVRFTPNNSRLKPSFNFFFRDELGKSPQDYPFFPGNPVTKFEDIRLRAGKNDIQNPFIKDELMRRIFIGTGQKGSQGIFATLFINGAFKGYFNLCEHLREAFMQEHHNSDAAWDVRQTSEFASGDPIHWNSMMAVIRSNDLSTTAGYAAVHDYLDVDNFIDYLLVNIFAATWDWPNNNWVAARERSGAGRWRFYVWDAEGAFGQSGRNPATYDIFIGDTNGDGVPESSENVYKLDIGAEAMTTTSAGRFIGALYTLLKASPEFRLRFADRAQRHFFHGGCLTKASMEGIYLSLRDEINPIMQETIGQTVNQTFFTNWIYLDTRRVETFVQLAQYGLWFGTLAPEYSQHGGEITPGGSVSITNPNASGTIYFTTNGVDPRAAGGGVAGTAYSGPVPLNASVVMKARVLAPGGEWSPLQEVTFAVPVPSATFLPGGNADWTADANWSTSPGPYPNRAGVATVIGAPATADREVGLRAPVVVGSIRFEQGESPYRNRVEDKGSSGTNTLTFAATNGMASVIVDGTGPGFVEFEVEAGTVLASDLRLEVINIAGNVEYGALRLRQQWGGPGGLVKQGWGVASLTGDGKTYAGATVIQAGVLRVTGSSAPGASAAVSVLAGGQLRLVSESAAGEPTPYVFGGDIFLEGMGRGGPIPQQTGLGILGALRYEPPSQGNHVVVSNAIHFAGATDVHVDGSRNVMGLAGTLSGEHGFIKSGGGKVVLAGNSPSYVARSLVSNGVLAVDGRIGSALDVVAGATVSGSGRVGALRGDGVAAADATVLTAASAEGLDYGFSFGTNGSPRYASPGLSGNGVLRFLSGGPAGTPGLIDIYLDVPTLAAGDRLRGGFFVGSGVDLAPFLRGATVRFFVPDPGGAQAFAGRTYAPYLGSSPITVTTVPETADFGDGPRSGKVLEIRVAGPPVAYDEWMRENFPDPGDRANPLISGPAANPQRDGVANLLRYALDVAPGALARPALPRLSVAGGIPRFQFLFDPGKNDIAYLAESSGDLRDWSRVLFDSRIDPPTGWDGDTLTLLDDDPPGGTPPHQFYRLKILLMED